MGHFDEAFKSRIHVSLYYPQLDEETTKKIWKMNLQRLIENRDYIEVDNKAIKKYAKKHYMELSKAKRGPWNGRQIKNAFQTAIALAEFDSKTEGQTKPTLTTEHFKVVAKASEGFDKYLIRIHGTDMDRARREGQRDDEQSQAVVFPVTSKPVLQDQSSDTSSSDDSIMRKKSVRRQKSKKQSRSNAKSTIKIQDTSSDESTSSCSMSELSEPEERKSRKEKSLKKRDGESSNLRSSFSRKV